MEYQNRYLEIELYQTGKLITAGDPESIARARAITEESKSESQSQPLTSNEHDVLMTLSNAMKVKVCIYYIVFVRLCFCLG